jgi:hypothetical protein
LDLIIRNGVRFFGAGSSNPLPPIWPCPFLAPPASKDLQGLYVEGFDPHALQRKSGKPHYCQRAKKACKNSGQNWIVCYKLSSYDNNFSLIIERYKKRPRPVKQSTRCDDSCICANGRVEDTRRARRLEYLTIGWNLIEAGVALGAGIVAGSIALIGFGVDTLIEILSSLILLWRLLSIHPDEQRERIALKLVGVCFLLLAAYVGYEAVSSLALKKPPEASFAGIAVAILALVVMPLLARAKRRSAGRLNSAALSADSRQSSLCAYLSAILLGGLALNAAFSWWWADPAAALVMLPIIIKEGLEALRGEVCADGH